MRTNATSYYEATAGDYDRLHGDNENPEHVRALDRSWALLERLGIGSVLDVGCGTGRSLQWFDHRQPTMQLAGIDPSTGLLDLARKAVPKAALREGAGEKLPYGDGSFELVLATGIMHHVDDPAAVISEMVRVASKAVLISDHNNFAFGGVLVRRIRMGLRICGLLNLATFVKQGFRKQGYSDGDGWWYPYSLLDNYSQIAKLTEETFLIPTVPATADDNFIFAQSHFAVLALKCPISAAVDRQEQLGQAVRGS
jgi:SAM-dependent methyltransferase